MVSGRLKEVQSSTNCARIDGGGGGIVRSALVGCTLEKVFNNSGRSLLLTLSVALQARRTCSIESKTPQREQAGLLPGWSAASLSLVR